MAPAMVPVVPVVWLVFIGGSEVDHVADQAVEAFLQRLGHGRGGGTVRANSFAVRSHFCARVSSGKSSDTSWPIRCPPKSSLYVASATSLTKPLGSPAPCALALAV